MIDLDIEIDGVMLTIGYIFIPEESEADLYIKISENLRLKVATTVPELNSLLLESEEEEVAKDLIYSFVNSHIIDMHKIYKKYH